MATIKKIKVLQAGKIFGLLYVILGFIMGIIITTISLITPTTDGMFGVLAIVIMPIIYGAIGFIFGLGISFFYNIIAKLVGGLEIEIEK